jgi:hypothetical protein
MTNATDAIQTFLQEKKYTLVVLVLKSVHKSIKFSVISLHLLKEVHYNIQCTVFPDGILGF